MDSLIKQLFASFEKIKLAEIEPGFILMMLIWLFSSFFSKKKTKKKKASKYKHTLSQKFESLLRKLDDLSEIDVNQTQEIYTDSEAILVDEKSIKPELNTNTIYKQNPYIQDEIDLDPIIIGSESIIKPISVSKSKHKEIKLFGTPLQKAMVLREILDKPRALKPFSFKN